MPKKKTLVEEMAPPERVEIWPNGIVTPVVGLQGDMNTGKSTFFAAMRDLGSDLVIIAFDMEGSMANIGAKHGIEVIDVRQMVYDKFYGGQPVYNYTNGQLFECWLEAVTNHPGGDIAIMDTISRVYLGANEWTRKNPKMFNKEINNYWGDGQMFSWGDTNNILWPNLIQMLRAKFQIVALLSHMKDTYEEYMTDKGKKATRKTGKRVVRGTDFGAECTLVIELCRDPDDPNIPVNKLNSGVHGGLYGIVRKDRIPHTITVTPEYLAEKRGVPVEDINRFDPELGVKEAKLLPKRLIPGPMQPYHRLMFGYMLKPQLDYGTLNDLVYDPAEMPEDERKAEADALAIEKAEATLRARTEERKQELMRELKELNLYATGAEVAMALKALGLGYSLEEHETVLAALIEYANGRKE